MKSSDDRKNRTGIVFLLIFIGLAAGIVTGGYFTYQNYGQNFRAAAEHQLSAIAELKVNQLVQYRTERLGDANTLFKNPAFSNLVKQFFEKTDNGNAKRQLQRWLASFQSYYSYDGILLLDTRGSVRMSVPDTSVPIAKRNLQNVANVLRSGTIEFQDFYRSEHNQKAYLAILVPIIDDTGPYRQEALLLLRIDPEVYLYPLIQTWPVPSRTSETLIVRREGNDAVFLNELRFQKKSALNLRIPLSNETLPAAQAALGHMGVMEGFDYRGEPVIAAIRSVPNSPWSLVARIDKSEVYEPLRARLWLMIVLVGALVAGAGAGVGLVWRHQRNSFYREQYESAGALRDSESRYRRLFEAARDGILILDAETGEIVDMNPFLIEILGYSREMFIGKSLWEIGSFKDIAANKERFLELQHNSYVRYKDLPLATSDGRVIDVEFVSNAYLVDHHGIIQCNIRDITERKRNETELRRLYEMSERSRLDLLSILEDQKRAQEALTALSLRQEAILAAVPDIIMEVDNKKVYTWANHSGIEFFGDDVVGKEAAVYFEGEQNIYANVQPLFNGNEQIIYVESWQRRKDGQKRLLGWWCRLLKDGDGKVIGALSSARDITESKRAEEALRESEDKFKYVFDYSIVGKSITQLTGEISANKAFYDMLGYSPGELQDQRWRDISHPDDMDLTQREIDSLLSGEKDGARFTKRYLHKNGSVVWADVSTSLRRDQQGKPLYLMTTVLDITERHRAEEEIQRLNAELEQRVIERTAQLEAANKELEAFSYSVSHDLRAPLRAVDGFSRIVLEEYGKKLDPEAGRLLNVICASTQKMDELITDLLDLSRVSRNEMNLSRVAMAMLANSIYNESASADIREKFSFSVEPIPDAYCDPVLMRQVWRNLISNAVKFTTPKDERKIEIGGSSQGGMNVYFIRDSGVGFDPRYSHKLFGVFQRLHKAEEFEGTGVGLAIVQRIIQRHGGKVWAEGRVGEGATFWFSIPNRQQGTGNSQ